MTLVIMNKLDVIKELREIARREGCHLTLKAALKIADWLKEQCQPESEPTNKEREVE